MKYRHIKLPRKRKKEFIKETGRENYMPCRVVGEILVEQNRLDGHKFPRYPKDQTIREFHILNIRNPKRFKYYW